MKNWIRIRLFLWAAILALCFAGTLNATPIRPKLEDLIKQADHPRMVFPPSRVAWNGIEQSAQPHSFNLMLEQYGPEGSTRLVRASLMEALIPDMRALLAIGLIILLLRILRSRDEKRMRMKQATSAGAFSNQANTAATHELKAA